MRRILLSTVEILSIPPCGILWLLSCLRKTHNNLNFPSATCSKIELLLPRKPQDMDTASDAMPPQQKLRDHFSVVAQQLYLIVCSLSEDKDRKFY